ncbi:sialic acid-binding Ig-like lectin 7 [Periophthalmus magnuspinnatus]|uniref:sialic acid-binding Ig-like lectin 7 n=1 Tax=Periophthalmus magnuspinnatus TaxID=409849 RepID=UPI002436DDF3|nr:sialic acid-binding Ig-like lectin 7 [Periophthalmus magnuspinnatus]
METYEFLILLLCSGTFGCIYPRDLTVSVPNLEALNGSCLLIPCTFSIPNQHEDKIDLSKPVVAIWSDVVPNIGRPADPVFFHSDMTSLTSPMEMIGDLQQKNCTMLFSDINTNHSDDYFLRIENYKYKATAGCNPLKINVQESAWIPSVQVSGSQREQETVTITCSAPSPCPHSPPELTWSFQPELPHNMLQSFPTSVQHMVQNSDGTFHTSVQLQMRLSENYHGLEVRCSAVYPVKEGHKTAHGNITVRIEHSPMNTSAQLCMNTFPPSVGQSVDLRCSCRAWPPVQSFTWFRVTSQGPQRVYEGQVYSLIFNHTTQGEYFCQAQNQVGKQNSSTIKLQPEEANIEIGLYTILKICGIVVLFSALLLIECCKRRMTQSRNPEI